MITAVPTVTPVTTPLDEPIVATEGEPEDHIPPVTLLPSVVDELAVHAVDGPVIGPGDRLTVIGFVVKQPVGSV